MRIISLLIFAISLEASGVLRELGNAARLLAFTEKHEVAFQGGSIDVDKVLSRMLAVRAELPAVPSHADILRLTPKLVKFQSPCNQALLACLQAKVDGHSDFSEFSEKIKTRLSGVPVEFADSLRLRFEAAERSFWTGDSHGVAQSLKTLQSIAYIVTHHPDFKAAAQAARAAVAVSGIPQESETWVQLDAEIKSVRAEFWASENVEANLLKIQNEILEKCKDAGKLHARLLTEKKATADAAAEQAKAERWVKPKAFVELEAPRRDRQVSATQVSRRPGGITNDLALRDEMNQVIAEVLAMTPEFESLIDGCVSKGLFNIAEGYSILLSRLHEPGPLEKRAFTALRAKIALISFKLEREDVRRPLKAVVSDGLINYRACRQVAEGMQKAYDSVLAQKMQMSVT